MKFRKDKKLQNELGCTNFLEMERHTQRYTLIFDLLETLGQKSALLRLLCPLDGQARSLMGLLKDLADSVSNFKPKYCTYPLEHPLGGTYKFVVVSSNYEYVSTYSRYDFLAEGRSVVMTDFGCRCYVVVRVLVLHVMSVLVRILGSPLLLLSAVCFLNAMLSASRRTNSSSSITGSLNAT